MNVTQSYEQVFYDQRGFFLREHRFLQVQHPTNFKECISVLRILLVEVAAIIT